MAVSLSQHKRMSPRGAARLRRQVRVRKKVFGVPESAAGRQSVSAAHLGAGHRRHSGPYARSASTMEAGLRTRLVTSPRRPSRLAALSPSVPRQPASRAWSSTAPATSTTDGLRRSRMVPAKAALDFEGEGRETMSQAASTSKRRKVERIDWNPAPHWRCRWGASRP